MDSSSLLWPMMLRLCPRSWNLKVERSKGKLKRLMEKNPKRPRCLLAKSKVLLEDTESFCSFIDKNYVKSPFSLRLREDVRALNKFFEVLVCKGKGDMSKLGEIKAFKTPNAFKDVEGSVEACKESEDFDMKAIRKCLMDELEKRVSPFEGSLEMPFLPVLYDLAYDFIEYPDARSREKHVSKFISRLLFRK